MFATPAAAIAKLSNCGTGQPDDTLINGYPLVDIFNKKQRFIDIAKQSSIYFPSLPNPPESRPIPRRAFTRQSQSQHTSRAFYPDIWKPRKSVKFGARFVTH